MRKNSHLAAVFAAVAFISLVRLTLAQESGYTFGIRNATSKALGDDYYFYAGEMYGDHAYDHADVLNQYASVGQPVPAAVVQEHAAAIRSNLAASAKSFSKLSKDFKDNPEAEKHLAAIHEHHKNALAAVDKLEASAKSGTADAQAAAANAAAIQTELSAASGEHHRLMQKHSKTTIANKQ